METARILSGFANLGSENDCSSACSFRDVTSFRIFSRFFKEIRYKKFHKIWNSHLYSKTLSEYSQELWFLPPIMTAQILVEFEICRFLWFFFKTFSENPNLISFLKLNFLTLHLWDCQSTLKVSGVANLASKCDCSSLCSFPDITTVFFFFLKFQKT